MVPIWPSSSFLFWTGLPTAYRPAPIWKTTCPSYTLQSNHTPPPLSCPPPHVRLTHYSQTTHHHISPARHHLSVLHTIVKPHTTTSLPPDTTCPSYTLQSNHTPPPLSCPTPPVLLTHYSQTTHHLLSPARHHLSVLHTTVKPHTTTSLLPATTCPSYTLQSNHTPPHLSCPTPPVRLTHYSQTTHHHLSPARHNLSVLHTTVKPHTTTSLLPDTTCPSYTLQSNHTPPPLSCPPPPVRLTHYSQTTHHHLSPARHHLSVVVVVSTPSRA